jgi:hypothetical protein
MNEAIAYNYFLQIEEYGLNGLDSSLWVRYIVLGNEITGKKVYVRKCSIRVKQIHAHLSDYFKLKQ